MADDTTTLAGTHGAAGGQQGASASTAAEGTAQTGTGAAGQQTAATGTQTATVLNAGDKTAPATQATWPDDWRDRFAAGDEKMLGRLKRFTSPDEVGKSWRAMEQRMSSGEVKTQLPKDATPEQITTWRTENGIPAEAGDYAKHLPAGLVIGDGDKKMISEFFTTAHAKNAPPEVVGAMVDWYYKNSESIQAEQQVHDQTAVKSAEDALRAQYGGDYRTNLNGLETLFGRDKDGSYKGSFYMPAEVANAIANARTSDGRPLLADPKTIDHFVTLSRELYPDVFRTIAPGSSGAPGANVETRIGELEKLMNTNRKEYIRSGADKELLQLYDARDRQKKRNAA